MAADQYPLTPFELAYVDQISAYYARRDVRSDIPVVVVGERIVEIAYSNLDKSS